SHQAEKGGSAMSKLKGSLLLVVLAACGGKTPEAAVTYWKDVAPVVNAKCLGCHQQGGIAPVQLETYDQVKLNAASIAAQVSSGRMPPYLVKHDGTCGNFEA